jgi:hypothetical protein
LFTSVSIEAKSDDESFLNQIHLSSYTLLLVFNLLSSNLTVQSKTPFSQAKSFIKNISLQVAVSTNIDHVI